MGDEPGERLLRRGPRHQRKVQPQRAGHPPRQGTIFTNVAHNLDDNTVWWEGLDKNPPKNALNWKGEPWNGTDGSRKGAHPNSRFTAPAKNCPCISSEFDNPKGVPISAIVFGGRRAKTAPLVYQSRDWDTRRVRRFHHGLRDHRRRHRRRGRGPPRSHGHAALLRLPHGRLLGQHWLEMGEKLGDKAPKIFNVNWFRTG